jgi:hypothetical protein
MIFRLLTGVLFYAYVLMLLCVGGSGVVIGSWEISRMFFVDLGNLKLVDQATFIDEYRYLMSLELAFGIFAITYRKEIFKSPKANGVFLAGLFAGVIERVVSLILDGRPRPAFIAFFMVEVACGGAVLIYSRKTLVKTCPV